MENPCILVVDDEEDLCEIIKFNLEAENYDVDTANSAEEALKLQLSKYQLFIFDVMMGAMSGFKLADEIRKKQKIETPIIFITAKNTENDKLTGFSIGADDYITKPFSVRELIARVKVVLRRGSIVQNTDNNNNIKISGIELDLEKKKITIDNEKIDLTPIEFEIMNLLLKNLGKVFSREQILHQAWKESNVTDRTVDVHITRLRKKIGNYGKYLISRSGYGYCFEID